MAVKTYKKGLSKKLTTHFNLSEMACKGNGCCTKTLIDVNIVKYAEKIRVMLGVPITINSAYRCLTHNSAVGGANGSGHCLGTALDIATVKYSNLQIAIAAEIVGCPRIGIYDGSPNMAHIGLGVKLHWHNTGNYLPTSHSFIGDWATPKKLVSAKSNAKYIRYVQACLYAKGFYTGKLDGIWGAKTQKAINAYRKAKGWSNATYLKSKAIAGLLK